MLLPAAPDLKQKAAPRARVGDIGAPVLAQTDTCTSSLVALVLS